MATKKYTVKASADNAVKADWASNGKKKKISKSFELGNFFLFELGKDFIGISINNSYPDGKAWLGARTVKCDNASDLYAYLQENLADNATWNQVERTIANSEFDAKIDNMGGFVSDKDMNKPTESVDSACGKKKSVKSSAKRKPMMNSVKSSKKSVKASSVDGDRPNSAPNSWKSSQRMAYKVTEDQTKGERSFPTSIDDVYKVLGEMQGTWTNPTTGWTGECEIYERDLDDGSYIFSLIFGGNELEPDDILYDPNGNNYYSNKPKFTIYPHSGAPIFADSIEDFKRKLKKEYSYLKKVGDNVGASMKKQPAKKSVKASSMRKPMRKTIKASSMAKRRASKRVMAAYNGEDLVMYFDGKKVYQGQPGADMYDAVLKLCENDTNRLKFQEWCNQFGDPLFEEGEYGDAGETAYVFCELIYQEFNDGSDGEDGNGILNFEIFPASQEVSGATSVKCTQGDFTYDFSEDEFPFRVTSYYDHSQRGIADGASFSDMDEAVDYAHEKLSEGPVRIEHYEVGAVDINPDEYWENFDGEFWCTPELAEWRDAVWRSMGINASTKAVKAGINAPSTEGPLCVCENCKAEIESREGRQTVYNVISDLDIEPDEKLVCDWCEDEATELYQISPDDVSAAEDVEDMDYISGEDDEVDFGYGFTPNGEAISESMVDELCRIANEILEKSELAKVSSWCDIDRDSFDYWCDGSAYVSEKFTITFTYTAELMTFNKFVKEDAWWTPSAEHGLGFEINVKDGEIESVTYTDKYWAGNSTPLDNAADIFDIEALEAYIGELAAPVAMDIYNGTTNI